MEDDELLERGKKRNIEILVNVLSVKNPMEKNR